MPCAKLHDQLVTELGLKHRLLTAMATKHLFQVVHC